MSDERKTLQAGRDTAVKLWTEAGAECEALRRENAALRAALEEVEAALQEDSRDKTISADTVEYHLDGQTMYHAINKVRAALAAARGNGNG